MTTTITHNTTCGWAHDSGMAHAVGRFNPDGPAGYRARSGGPLRATRAEAAADECANHHRPHRDAQV